MKLSLQFPLHTKSENVNRRFGNPFARAASTARERRDVRLFLDSQLPKPRLHLPGGPNFFRVTLVRISAGVLDSDAVGGALKAVRDEVAAWLGIHDGPNDPASWIPVQQRCHRGFHAVRIEIEDDDPDKREVHKILGPVIPELGPIIGDCVHCGRPEQRLVEVPKARRAARKTTKVEQRPLVFRRVFYALPDEQNADQIVMREETRLGDNPPRTITVRHHGKALLMERRLERFEDVGEVWLYEVPPVAAE